MNTAGFAQSSWDEVVVLVAGVSWDDAWLSEKHLAMQLSRRVPVLFVDPAISFLTPLRKPQLRESVTGPRLREVAPNIARLTPLAPPGISRPLLRDLAHATTRVAIRDALKRLGARASALIVASLDPFLDACPADVTAIYGTDDWVSGASLMGLSTRWLERRERAQLAAADLVITVSSTLAERWSPLNSSVTVIPNGCDVEAFAATDSTPAAADVHLPGPVAGFIGHMSERIDLDLIDAVARTGHSVLLVGPRQLTFDPSRLDALLARENVQWTGPRPFPELPSYMRHITVGLTPYTNSAFNRSSFPLKTLEYLAAGRAAVVTDLPSARSLPEDLAVRCDDPASFAAATVAALEAPPDPELAARRRAFAATQSWAARADDVARLLGLPGLPPTDGGTVA